MNTNTKLDIMQVASLLTDQPVPKRVRGIDTPVEQGSSDGHQIPIIITRQDLERRGISVPDDPRFVEVSDQYITEDLVRGSASMRRMTELLKKAQERFDKKQPIFREAASFREETGAMFAGMKAPDWYSELLADRKYQAVIGAHGNRADLHSTLMTWMVMKLREVSDSSNWFRPSDALAYKLIATDLKGTVVGDLHLPMDAFYIEMPPNIFFLWDKKTGWHEVRTLTVARGQITERTIEIAREHGDKDADMTALGGRLLIECYAEPNENSRDPFDDSWLFMSYVMKDEGTDIESVLNSSIRDPRVEKLNKGRCGERELNGIELREFLLKFVLNFCIYLGSEKVKVEHTHTAEIERLQAGKKWKNLRKNVQERIQKLKNDRVFEVGTDVTIDNELREHVRRGGMGGYSHTYRSLVRGHWRNQAHGPGWTLRTRKWIEPHVRGADLPTQTVGHNYKVK